MPLNFGASQLGSPRLAVCCEGAVSDDGETYCGLLVEVEGKILGPLPAIDFAVQRLEFSRPSCGSTRIAIELDVSAPGGQRIVDA